MDIKYPISFFIIHIIDPLDSVRMSDFFTIGLTGFHFSLLYTIARSAALFWLRKGLRINPYVDRDLPYTKLGNHEVIDM